jgi:hypothetical protein
VVGAVGQAAAEPRLGDERMVFQARSPSKAPHMYDEEAEEEKVERCSGTLMTDG